jgi:hypothetical protein
MLVIISLCWTVACAHDVDRDVVFECRPNGGAIKAVYWEETSGIMAAGTVYYWVSLIPSDKPTGEALSVPDPSGTIARLHGTRDVRFVWTDPGTLRIEYPDTATFSWMAHGTRWQDVDKQNIQVDSRPVPSLETSFITASNRCVASPAKPVNAGPPSGGG